MAEPRDAATVMLLRDGAVGIEVWMMRRRPAMAFAPDAWVFPGGAVADAHLTAADLGLRGLPDDLASGLGVGTARAVAILEAAVRELYEEADVLLARTDGVPWMPPPGSGYRRAIIDQQLTLPALLAESGAEAAIDALCAWDRWLTPEWSPRRYDTWFFACAAREWSAPQHVEDGEATRSEWRVPAVVLAEHAAGEAVLLPPTLAMLERIDAHPDVASALADVRAPLRQRSG
jgi:8-oxo-dGTP pyrophosphatase MutT (NUDIX family)